jgi:hypothetical protein
LDHEGDNIFALFLLGSGSGIGVACLSPKMKRSLHVPIAPGRKIGAWVCLAAVTLLWTPLWAAAWQVHGMECCDGGMCAAHGHSKPNHSRPQHRTRNQAPMNCEQHGLAEISSCSISCCQESNPSFAAAIIFVLPESAPLSQPALTKAARAYLAPTESVLSFEPLSPPPRSPLFSL